MRAKPSILSLLMELLSTCNVAAHGAKKFSEAGQLTPLPAGLTLPVRLSHGLRAGSVKVGTPVLCLTTQRIPVSAQEYLPAGVQVLGSVEASEPSLLKVHLTALRSRGRTVPAVLETVAIANFSNVEDTYDPVIGGGDRENNTPANWTTLQVGGDVLTRFNWDGEVDNHSSQRVGFSDFYGVYADPVPNSTEATALPHAIGVFSTTAQGLYGFASTSVLKSGPGDFTVTAAGGIVLRTGDQLLLRAVVPKQP